MCSIDARLSRRTTHSVSATTSAVRGAPKYIATSPTTTPELTELRRLRVPSVVVSSTRSLPDSSTNRSSGGSPCLINTARAAILDQDAVVLVPFSQAFRLMAAESFGRTRLSFETYFRGVGDNSSNPNALPFAEASRVYYAFVDVQYGTTTDVQVGMKQYPIVTGGMQAKPGSKDTIIFTDPPVWRRWYVTGPAIVVLAVGAGILAGVIAHDFPQFDNCRKVGGNPC